ncbi:MAG TPA: hypothetical protein VFT74_02790 [Isosphaeraceae bacterium]|nr:hypothetical protein [Isosphaeraceae bacterium]
MTIALITLGVVCLGLLGVIYLLIRERTAQAKALDLERGGWALERTSLITANNEERKAWADERRDLNNRIQVPESAPFMDTPDTGPQYVPFDDDDTFIETTQVSD